ncbi:DNA replication protein [Levilactobacillus brevis]|uniref:ATP-binding protein n=1 Tax=Levilactobacillus brevis TaxID=1580 RepID=UPI001121AFB1|nr:ATP-binding protein [Levilactobacillus brevis]TOY85746.1 DNA replication protein [Levilactobacillus brevis]
MEVSTSNNPFKLLNSVQSTDRVCPKHGEQMVQLPGKPPFCLRCQKEKISQREAQTVKKAEAYWQKRKTSDVLKRDSIFDDPDLKYATFHNFEATGQEAKDNWNAARKIAYQYLEADSHFNTLFTGYPGRGKSHLALSILKAVNANTKQPVSCLFVSVNELMRLIRDSFNYPDSKYTEENMVSLLGHADLLVLDDLGSESSFKRESREASEFTQNVLFGILNNRNRTIITTNLNSNELSAIYNPKLLSRMYKGIKGHIIKFTEKTPDRRSVEF